MRRRGGNRDAGWNAGRVDYDERERESRIENDREYAVGVTCRIMQQLEQIRPDGGARPLQVKLDCGGQEDQDNWSESSVARELQFLAGHTIHHYALIAVILRLENKEPAEGFGVAPSTLKYLRDRARCAQ